jgi:AAA+ superfamily predicted ATPase
LPVRRGEDRRGQERIRPRNITREMVMTIKNVVVPLEIEYLREAAKKRGISRTKLVQVVMEKVVKDELVLAILDDDDQLRNEPPQPRYRRFR